MFQSLFRRIADSLSAFVPSNIFPSVGSESSPCDGDASTFSSCKYEHNRPIILLEERETQTSSALNARDTLDVDLDALDNSDCEVSAHSSTSGVSSLLPRNCNFKTWSPLHEAFDNHPGDGAGTSRFKKQGTFSDITNSITSDSTFKSSSVTPWIMSLKTKPQESMVSSRPVKKQRLSSALSSCSSVSELEKRSVFYQGKTTYGGASSCRLPLQSGRTIPLRFELEPSTGSGAAALSGPNLSSTARRILESLERFSTPLTMADRIPFPGHADTLQQTTTTPMRTQKLHRFPPYLEAYRRLKYAQRKAMGVSTASSVQSGSLIEPSVNTASSGTAVSVLTGTNTSIELAGISSATSSGLRFHNSSPPSRISNNRDHAAPSTSTDLLESSKTTCSTASSTTFTFAPPIRKSNSLVTHLAFLSPSELPSAYTFSTPQQPRGSCALLGDRFQLPHSETRRETSVSKSISSPVFDLIMDSSRSSDIPLGGVSNATESKRLIHLSNIWRCATCLLENSEVVDACTACSTPRLVRDQQDIRSDQSSRRPLSPGNFQSILDHPASTTVNGNGVSEFAARHAQVFNLNDDIRNSSAKWECPTCMVFNDYAKSSCVCCQTSKPASGPPDLTSSASTTKASLDPVLRNSNPCTTTATVCSSFPVTATTVGLFRFGFSSGTANPPCQPSSLISQPSILNHKPTPPCDSANNLSKWECPTCMVFNDGDKSSCVCCRTLKPVDKLAAPISQTDASKILSTSVLTSFASPTTTVTQSLPSVIPSSGLFRFGLSSSGGTASSPFQPNVSVSQPAFFFGQNSTPSCGGAKNSSKWECPTCMVFNDCDKFSCVCCQTPKPVVNQAGSTSQADVSRSLPDTVFKNVDSSTTTIAQSLPSAIPSSGLFRFGLSSSGGTANSLFQPNASVSQPAVVLAQNSILSCGSTNNSNKWECPTCMVFNDCDKSFCVCCQTPKPIANQIGSTSQADTSKSLPNPGFKSFSSSVTPVQSLPPLTPASNIFSFGLSNATGNSPLQPNPGALQPSIFGQNGPSTGDNVFSITSSNTVPRKKAHAVRRLQR
ncbi:unnamed protein product [Dicrocoelium dendriticum]|nr:unnamed protein product [Dicrocoelium dendriticum]